MRWLTRLRQRVRCTLSRTHDRELRDELQLHLDLLTDDYVAQGLSQDAARARAHREFGNLTRFQETSHDLFAFGRLETVLTDASYAVRDIRRSPGFTAVAVVSLAVGIGAVTTTASIVDALLLRGLPVHEPDRLVALSRASAASWSRWPYGLFRFVAEAPDAAFRTAAVYALSEVEQPLLPGGDGQPLQRVRVSLVSGSYFDVLGVSMQTGRAIRPADDRPGGGNRVAVISHAFWARHFAQAPDVIGRTLPLNGASYEVIGVAATRFTGEWIGQPTDVWLPLALHPAITRSRAAWLSEDSDAHWLRVMARPTPGVTLTEAAASANLLWHRFLASPPAARRGPGVPPESIVLLSAETGYAPQRQQYARPLMIISAIVGLVLVVACANFSNLLYGRSRSRQQEYAVRLVLGAGRWRIVRQSLVECVLLAGLAAALGAVAAAWATTGSLKLLATTLQPLDLELGLDARILAVTAGCMALVVVFGLVPSLRWMQAPAVCLLQASMRQRRRNVVGRLFLVSQLALCVVMLIGTGLMLRTVANLRGQQLGFDRNVLLLTVAPAQAGYSGEAAALLLQRIRERLLATSGIDAVSATGAALMDNRTYWIDASERLSVAGRQPVSGAAWTVADVGAGFFRTVGMPLIHGRDFTEADIAGPSDATIINHSLSRLLFGGDDPLGQRISTGPSSRTLLVIGVVNDVRQTSPRDRGLAVMYRPLQRPPAQVQLAVRTQGNAADRIDVVRHQLFAMDRNLPIVDIRTIEDVLNDAIGQERLLGTLGAWLGVLVVVVCCLGLYALIANDVVERTHELGVRLALGATRGRVALMILRDCAIVAALALAAGLPLGLAAVAPLSSQLYGVEPNDPQTLASVVLLLLAVAFVAGARPARAAARVDPVVLLRAD